MNDDVDTWYVLADGTHAHPGDVETGEDGVLKSKAGVPVALREGGLPLTSGVATKSNEQAAKAGKPSKADKRADKPAEKPSEVKADLLGGGDGKPDADNKTLKPEDQSGAGYTTRESKAE